MHADKLPKNFVEYLILTLVLMEHQMAQQYFGKLQNLKKA